jgi:hypothetical protein
LTRFSKQADVALADRGRKEVVGQMGFFIQSGHIKDYDYFILNNSLVVIDQSKIVSYKLVDGLEKFVKKAKQLRAGWAQFPSFEVIYLYDKSDGNFGYAINLQDPSLSEWGYAPFSA